MQFDEATLRTSTLAALVTATVAFQFFAWRACRAEVVTPLRLLREEGSRWALGFVAITLIITLVVIDHSLGLGLGLGVGSRWGVSLPISVRWMGPVLALCGALGIAWTMASLRDNHTITVVTRAQHQLVTWGPYRWVRHPLYAFALLMCVGFFLATGSLLLAAATAAGIPLGQKRMVLEEAALVARFGDLYRSFMATRGRIFPLFYRLRSSGGTGLLSGDEAL